MTSNRAAATIALAGLAVLLGCSSTTTAMRPDRLPPEQGAAQAKAVAGVFAGKEVDVELASRDPESSEPYLTGTLAATPDGRAFVLSTPSAAPQRIAFDNTRTIIHRNGLAGAGEGFLIGAISGAMTGLMVSAATEDWFCGPPSATCIHSGGDPTLGLAAIGAVTGGAFGALIGWAVGHRKIVSF